MTTIHLPSKDPDDTDFYFVVWCDIDGTNDGTNTDDGELQGATISTSTWTVPAGVTEDSSDTNSVTIQGVTYAANTVATILVSSGTNNSDYELTNVITTSDGRTLSKSIIIPIRQH